MNWFPAQSGQFREQVRATKSRGVVRISFLRFPSLHGRIQRDGLTVEVERNGIGLDCVFEADCKSLAVENGVICALCEANNLFRDHEHLWRDHVFESFKRWLEDDLAETLGVYTTKSERYSYAKLLKAADLRDMFRGASDRRISPASEL